MTRKKKDEIEKYILKINVMIQMRGQRGEKKEMSSRVLEILIFNEMNAKNRVF